MKLIELPTFEATWWPLQMETVPGSGERLTVGVVARARTGQAQARQAIPPAALMAMFGSAGKGMQAMVSATVIGLQQQLDEGCSVEELRPAFGGFFLGQPRDGVARDFNEVFDVALRLSAAFAQSAFGQQQELSVGSREAFNDWAQSVEFELRAHEVRVAWEDQHFQVSVNLARKKVRFAVVRQGYAANLGVLRPGHTSGDSRSLKVKVFDLEALRRDSVLPVDHVEILVGCPPATALSAFSRREVDGFHASFEFIDAEARARGVPLIRCDTAAQAAAHIQRRVA